MELADPGPGGQILLVEGLQQDGLDPIEAIPFLIRKLN